jgi:putative mRNA 3-end processing factor
LFAGICMTRLTLLELTPSGLYCRQAEIYIDPWKPVERAVITHAHSDHARPGSKQYLAHHDSEAILRLRLGSQISLQTLAYGEKVTINGVQISLHPAGHIIGSAQVRLAYQGEIWVVSGDYKLEDDGFAAPFEPVACHTFITESTFGLPVYRWRPQSEIMNEIILWWQKNREKGETSILLGYALGKMQRLVRALLPSAEPVFAHGTIISVNQAFRQSGFDLPEIKPISQAEASAIEGALVLATGSVLGTPWMNRFKKSSVAFCSGWMAIRGAKNRTAADRGFVLSDHADWQGLNDAVTASGAERVLVTHGYSAVFSRWLQEKGLDASILQTRFGEEHEEEALV